MPPRRGQEVGGLKNVLLLWKIILRLTNSFLERLSSSWRVRVYTVEHIRMKDSLGPAILSTIEWSIVDEMADPKVCVLNLEVPLYL